MKTPLQILQFARAKLSDPVNWSTDSYGPGTEGPACLVGWLRIADCGHIGKERSKNYETVHTVLCTLLTGHAPVTADDFSSISGWNDAPGRTHQEVLNLLDKAIREFQNERRV